MIALHELARVRVLKSVSGMFQRVCGPDRQAPVMIRKTNVIGADSYLEGSGPDKSVSAKVAADVGGDDLTINTIARHEVHVLSRRALCVGLTARLLISSCHIGGCAGLTRLCGSKGGRVWEKRSTESAIGKGEDAMTATGERRLTRATRMSARKREMFVVRERKTFGRRPGSDGGGEKDGGTWKKRNAGTAGGETQTGQQGRRLFVGDWCSCLGGSTRTGWAGLGYLGG